MSYETIKGMLAAAAVFTVAGCERTSQTLEDLRIAPNLVTAEQQNIPHTLQQEARNRGNTQAEN